MINHNTRAIVLNETKPFSTKKFIELSKIDLKCISYCFKSNKMVKVNWSVTITPCGCCGG